MKIINKISHILIVDGVKAINIEFIGDVFNIRTNMQLEEYKTQGFKETREILDDLGFHLSKNQSNDLSQAMRVIKTQYEYENEIYQMENLRIEFGKSYSQKPEIQLIFEGGYIYFNSTDYFIQTSQNYEIIEGKINTPIEQFIKMCKEGQVRDLLAITNLKDEDYELILNLVKLF